MSKDTAMDYIKETMFEDAKADSKNAGGWEAIEDAAQFKISMNYNEYFISALIDYLQMQPYPTAHPIQERTKK